MRASTGEYPSRRFLLAGAGMSALAAASPLGAAAPATTITDLMPAFWRVYNPIAASPVEAQADRLVREFFTPRHAIYARAGVTRTDSATVARWLPKISGIIPPMRSLHAQFAQAYGGYAATFTQAFPDFDRAGAPVFLIPSLLHFDAHLQPSNGQLPLFFGLDGIVRFHGPQADLGVLFAHETFHCYQAQTNPAVMLATTAPLFASLWVEGGATWVSERLNPRASALHVLLDDTALAGATPDQVAAAATALLAAFDATDDAAATPFFASGWQGPWPARIGYLIGLAATREIAAAMPTARFARLSLGEMRALYQPRVQAMAETVRG
jgi:hypothetical protein